MNIYIYNYAISSCEIHIHYISIHILSYDKCLRIIWGLGSSCGGNPYSIACGSKCPGEIQAYDVICHGSWKTIHAKPCKKLDVTTGYDVHSSVHRYTTFYLWRYFYGRYKGLCEHVSMLFSPLADSQICLKRLSPANDLTLTRAKVPSLEQKVSVLSHKGSIWGELYP